MFRTKRTNWKTRGIIVSPPPPLALWPYTDERRYERGESLRKCAQSPQGHDVTRLQHVKSSPFTVHHIIASIHWRGGVVARPEKENKATRLNMTKFTHVPQSSVNSYSNCAYHPYLTKSMPHGEPPSKRLEPT